jgi:hypothetical protein
MRNDKLRQHALLCLDRLKAIVEHAQNLSDQEVIRMTGDIDEIYRRHVAMPEETINENRH